MNSDDFEKRLQRQPLRQIPSEWRENILQGAKSSRHSSFDIRHFFLSTLNPLLSTILWPNAKAWAGLAAVWVLIFALRLGASGGAPMMAAVSTPSSSDVVATFKDQQKLLAELIGSNEPREIDKPRQSPAGPHSELHKKSSMA